MNLENREIPMAREATSLENAAVVRAYESWELVDGYGWEDTRSEATNSCSLYLAAQEKLQATENEEGDRTTQAAIA